MFVFICWNGPGFWESKFSYIYLSLKNLYHVSKVDKISLIFFLFLTACSDDSSSEGPDAPLPPDVIEDYVIWDGPKTTFSKTSGADPANSANQDNITPSVAITRGNGGEIYNAISESEATRGVSPAGTRWAIGSVSNIQNLTFSSFRNTFGNIGNEVVGENLVLHIVDEDVYLSVTFLSWEKQQNGGAFSYERSTEE